MIENWLHTYLVESVRRNLCTQIYCTTCGAMEFRRGVINALAGATGAPPPDGMYRPDALAIARALSEVRPADPADSKLNSAARCLLFDICGTISEVETAQVLGDSWGGNVLRRMQEHDKARQAEHRARAEHENPINVQKRREEKKRLAQEKHQQRLALKKARDAAWRAKQGKPE